MLLDAHTHLDHYGEARGTSAQVLQGMVMDNWRRLVAGDGRLEAWA